MYCIPYIEQRGMLQVDAHLKGLLSKKLIFSLKRGANSKAALIEEGCLYSRIYNKLKNKKALRQCYIFKPNILLINIYGRGSLMQEGPLKYSKTFHTSQIYFQQMTSPLRVF